MSTSGQGVVLHLRRKTAALEPTSLALRLVSVNTKGKVSPAKSGAPASGTAHQPVHWISFLQEKSDLALLMGRVQIKAQAKMASSEKTAKGEGRETQVLFIYPKEIRTILCAVIM